MCSVDYPEYQGHCFWMDVAINVFIYFMFKPQNWKFHLSDCIGVEISETYISKP